MGEAGKPWEVVGRGVAKEEAGKGAVKGVGVKAVVGVTSVGCTCVTRLSAVTPAARVFKLKGCGFSAGVLAARTGEPQQLRSG